MGVAMAIYFIDYENRSDVNGFSMLNENDKVFIFYSDKNDKMTFEQHIEINESKAEIEYIKIYRPKDVKNALDFQLIFLLGRMSNENPQDTYYIVARDKGYTSIKKMCAEYGIKFKVIDNIKPTSKMKQTAAKDEQNDPDTEIKLEIELSDGASDDFKAELAEMLSNDKIQLTDDEIENVIEVSTVPFKQLIGAIKKQLGGDEEKARIVTNIVNKYRKAKKKKQTLNV